jgi:hypothetical protein
MQQHMNMPSYMRSGYIATLKPHSPPMLLLLLLLLLMLLLLLLLLPQHASSLQAAQLALEAYA